MRTHEDSFHKHFPRSSSPVPSPGGAKMGRQGLRPSRDLWVGRVQLQGVAPEHSVPWDAAEPIGAGLRAAGAAVNHGGEWWTISR